MDLGISGKVAVVSAASKGLGRAIAEALASEGARGAICARHAAAAERAGPEIQSATNAGGLAGAAGVTREEDCRRLVGAAAQRWGGIDILVNNSGGPAPGTFDALDDRTWAAAVESTLMN